MQGSRPRRLRFVVGSVLLVGAPLIAGCPEDEPPIVNTPPLPPNPFGTEEPPPQTPTMEGVGVPLPTPDAPPTLNTVPMPTPNTVAQPEPMPMAVEEVEPPPREEPRRFAPNPGPSERAAPTD